MVKLGGSGFIQRASTIFRDAERVPLADGALLFPVVPQLQSVAALPRPEPPRPALRHNRWKNHIGSAKLTWPKLSSHELDSIDSSQPRLVKLLLRHYSFDRGEAERQVSAFFARNRV